MAGFFLECEMGDQIVWFIVGSMALIALAVIISNVLHRRAEQRAKKKAHDEYVRVVTEIEDRVRIAKIRPAPASAQASIHSRIYPSTTWEDGFGGVPSHPSSSPSSGSD